MEWYANPEEFQIETPWGFIAGKSWGDQSKEIILVFHGLQDNAGAFDTLIPLLPSNFCYKCIDLPSHGRSSHFPKGLPIHSLDYTIAYKIIADHFKQESYIFMGHSYGGQISVLFAQLYPEYVKKLILLDTYVLYPINLPNFKSFYINLHEQYFNMMKKLQTNKQPTYSYEVSLQRLKDNRAYGDVTLEAAKALHARCVEKVDEDEYRFTLDPRLRRVQLNPQNDIKQLIKLMKMYPVTCPILNIAASESIIQSNYFKPIVQIMRKNKNSLFKMVEGNHNVHMNSPEVLAPIISQFLLKKIRSKL